MFDAFTQTGKRSILKISGSALLVSEGRVDALSMHTIHRNQFRFALGVGSFSDTNGVGEAIIIESKPLVSRVEEGKLQTNTEETFHSPFLVGIDSSQEIGAFIEQDPSNPMALHTLYDKASRVYPQGFVIVGYAMVKEFVSVYMTKAPIFGENINARHAEYWSSTCTNKNQGVSFVGVVLPPEARKKIPKEMVSRVLYQNPREKEVSSFHSHTHAALLETGSFVTPKGTHEFLKALKEAKVLSVRHMITDSVVQQGSFALFPIENIISVEKASQGPKEGRETLRYPFSMTV